MTNEEFKMNMYFEKYKNTKAYSLNWFKYDFRKVEGNYDRIDELFRKIQRYQIKKFGNVIGTGGFIKIENRKISKRKSSSIAERFGTKKERRARSKDHYYERNNNANNWKFVKEEINDNNQNNEKRQCNA